ncbi:MAG TPA: UvrD-helicase domain-containing protein [Gemmatimonadales bacterium]|jgi:DNA polymerase III epsilon subunit family exonuclease|nr:UvrD-helicase domain-containing protein [Gemmatimonadales bacterium]
MALTPLPQQRRAIEAPLGPVLVVAGPGAGKTFCLISRIEHVIANGIDPKRVCAVTFTNRAAEEIALRLGARAEQITRGTIHAFCLALLREYVDDAGLRRGFGVADEPYQKVILARLSVPLDRRGQLLTLFSRHRFQGHRLTDGDARLFREYVSWLRHRNMVDFDELITKAEPLADRLADRWDYVLVDEFQDVNAVQYDLLKKLVEPHGNCFVVGDDEQSIFAWTGADPMVLERFRRDYDVVPIILDKNRRCSRQIFETARRVLAQNPQLFQKQLTADQESPHEVVARGFRDEHDEATWLLEDIRNDRAASRLSWGDYAVLYRKHKVGEHIEGRLLRAGIPCRLARGRSLIEDEVIGYVIAALRVVRNPDDPAAMHTFAKCVLSQHFLQEVEAALSENSDFLGSARGLADRRPAKDPDTRKLWRLIYQLENLRALPRSHGTLPAVIEEILSQTVGPYRNKLEERHDELSDPADLPEAVELAAKLQKASEISFAPRGGVEIALRGMLGAAGFRKLPSTPAGTVIDADALTVFKALQLLDAGKLDTTLDRYVTFDFETTDNDAATCGVVEIGAVRVVSGEIVDRFHSMVNPYRPISPKASALHGYGDADVADAPPFHEVFTQFRAFVGRDVLIAHNGMKFDVPVLRRLAAGRDGVDSLVFYDTFPLVRSLSQDSPKQEDIAHRFGIDCGRAHHALDDAITLAHVYRELQKLRAERARKAVLSNVLDYLGLAMALESSGNEKRETGNERQLLFNIARYRTLGRYSDALEFYAATRTDGTLTLDEVIQRLGGRTLMLKLRAQRDPAQRYATAVARLNALVSEGTLEESIDLLLERVALSTSEGVELAPDRVNLLTLHSTKGLEFSRVYILGVEDSEILGYQATRDEIEEARRLLYVGMTRARDRLVLTRVERRFGRDTGGSSFLEEMGLIAPSQIAYSEPSS